MKNKLGERVDFSYCAVVGRGYCLEHHVHTMCMFSVGPRNQWLQTTHQNAIQTAQSTQDERRPFIEAIEVEIITLIQLVDCAPTRPAICTLLSNAFRLCRDLDRNLGHCLIAFGLLIIMFRQSLAFWACFRRFESSNVHTLTRELLLAHNFLISILRLTCQEKKSLEPVETGA